MTLLAEYFPNVIAILPAAGIGRRMQSPIPKQYHIIGNKTVLEHSISALLQQSCIQRVIIAISPNDRWFYHLPVAATGQVNVVIGGKTRADSVMSALRYINKAAWVLVHDAVRPCLHQDDLVRLLSVRARSSIGGILAIPVSDTIKRANTDAESIHYTVARNDLWHALTPQLFKFNLLKNCLKLALAAGAIITDESSALEYCGYSPLLVPGRPDNIKITCPEDLVLVSFYFSQLANREN